MGKIVPQRVSGFFGDELVLGSYLVRFLPLIVGVYIYVNFKEFNFNKTLILFSIILIFYIGITIYLEIDQLSIYHYYFYHSLSSLEK